MAKPSKLQVTERDTTLNPRQLRSAGFIPATVYSSHQEPMSIQVNTKDFVSQFSKGKRVFALGNLDITARAKKFQVDPVSQDVLSIEFKGLADEEVKRALRIEAEIQAEREAEKERIAELESMKIPSAMPEEEEEEAAEGEEGEEGEAAEGEGGEEASEEDKEPANA